MEAKKLDFTINEEKRHPIRVVVRRTGLSQELLRAWEIRYQAVTPERTDGGQRLYSDSDIERLQLIRQVLEGGRRIGQVARLSTAELKQLLTEDGLSILKLVRAGDTPPADPRSQGYLEQSLDAVRELDSRKLESVIRRAAMNLDGKDLIDKVLTPLLIGIGDLWRHENLTPGHERLATTVIRRILDELRISLANTEGPRLVVATPAGQHHEIGAMLAAVEAAVEGWQVIYLGPDLPSNSIATATLKTRSQAVALSLVYPDDDPELPQELRELRAALPPDVLLIVGGQAAGAYQPVLEEIGALWLPDAPALRLALDLVQASRFKDEPT
jgi:DNA-binding transcriptional MerR regulator